MGDLFANEGVACAFCQENLDFMSLSGREAHYEQHFTNDGFGDVLSSESSTDPTAGLFSSTSNATSSGSSNKSHPESQQGSSNDRKGKTAWKKHIETDPFWYYETLIPPPKNFTPGLIPLLRKGLLKGQSNQRIRKAVLCHDKAIHISRDLWDVSWGCGYRNFLMTCASLMAQTLQPLYFPLLDAPISPSIRNLQQWIEDAWRHGFDAEGQKQLKQLVGTRKWIGTADLWVAFAFRGIPAELVDFDLRKSTLGPEVVINWVVNYFSPKDSTNSPRPGDAFERMKLGTIQTTDKMPIILQHNGHSRTIVGYEVDSKGVTSLLVFDPGFKLPMEIRNAALKEFYQDREVPGDPPSPTDTADTASSSSTLKRKRSEEFVIVDVKTPRVEPPPSKTKSPKKVLSNIKNGLQHHNGKKDGSEVDVWAMANRFRLDLKNLSKKKEYQILYFPMTAPLTEHEKNKRKEVRSTKIT